MGPNKTLCGVGMGGLRSQEITDLFELSFDKGYIIRGTSSPLFHEDFNKRCLTSLAEEISVNYKWLHCHHFSFVQSGETFFF